MNVEINGIRLSLKVKEKELASALADTTILKLQAENYRLRQHVNLLSGVVTAAQGTLYPDGCSTAPHSVIFQKP